MMEFDFSQSTEVADITKVPEDFRGLYVREGEEGPYKLNSSDPGVKSAVAAITRMNSTLKRVRTELKSAEGKSVDLSGLSSYGTDVEGISAKIASTIKELEDQLKDGEGKKIDLDKIRNELKQVHTIELGKKDTSIKGLMSEITTLLVDNVLASELSSAGADDVELLIPFASPQVKVVEITEGEKVRRVPRVVDQQGDIRFSGVTGEPMTIKELAAEMKSTEKYDRFFKSTTKEGGGTPPGRAPTRAPGGNTTGEKTSVGKISSGLAARSRS